MMGISANLSCPEAELTANATVSPRASMLALLVPFAVAKVCVVLPPSVLVLYLGLRQRRCSHADVFTYHLAAVELLYLLGVALVYGGSYLASPSVDTLGSFLCSITIPAGPSFHALTCVERYLAVVHPVLYLGSRQAAGVRIRNASIGCVWLLCGGCCCVMWLFSAVSYVPFISFFALCLVLVSFCSLSVLRVLVRPGPGAVGRDQAKRRAVHTVTAILAVQGSCFLVYLVSFGLANSGVLAAVGGGTVALVVAFWCSLPSSLVLPALFLHRERNVCCH